jgi:hypothetical protein
MKEAGLLIGKTSKTIKNYIKRGLIKNYFLVDGKYGQEYKISVRDLEPLGIVHREVLEESFSTRGKDPATSGLLPGESSIIPGKMDDSGIEEETLLRRYEEVLLELGRCRERLEKMGEESSRLKQDNEEKDMLIQMLMEKESETGGGLTGEK